MRVRGLVSLAAVLAAVLFTAAPAPAQSEAGGTDPAGSSARSVDDVPPLREDPRNYALEDDQIVVDGELIAYCPSFLQTVEESYGATDSPSVPGPARKYVEVCTEAGFKPSGGEQGLAPGVAPGNAGIPARASDYVLEEDGSVVVDGDVVFVDCPSFAAAVEQGYKLAGNPQRAKDVLEQCEQAGLLASSGAGDKAAPPAVRGSGNGDDGTATLPGTGGAPPIMLAGLLLAGLGFLGVRRAKRLP